MSAKATDNISASEWLKIRNHVANAIKRNSSVQRPTLVAIAEGLLDANLIDLDVALEQIRPKPLPLLEDEEVAA